MVPTKDDSAPLMQPPIEPAAARAKKHLRVVAEWLFLGLLIGVGCGVGSAAFLDALDWATRFRDAHEVVIYALPLAGLALGALYQRFGKPIEGGNNLVIDTLHDDRPQLPLRMGPMVLLGTVLTHFFGGSAGREGTAVQMGASFADFIAHRFHVKRETRRQLLAAGIAGGFGSVFGTPIAGIVFGLEVVSVGRLEYDALFPALVASLTGDRVTRALGIVHSTYPAPAALGLTPLLIAKWALFALAVAATSTVFVELTHGLKHALAKRIPSLPFRMMVGGLMVVALFRLVGTRDYLGLGVPTILRSFSDPSLPLSAFALKLVFTAVTLASGFLGGEVTPLFFVGAALGNALGRALGIPIGLAAGVGLASLFATAANTPIALSIMAIELLGANVLPHVVIVAVIAYLASGHRGIYPAQRLFRRKSGEALPRAIAMRDYRTPPPESPGDSLP